MANCLSAELCDKSIAVVFTSPFECAGMEVQTHLLYFLLTGVLYLGDTNGITDGRKLFSKLVLVSSALEEIP